MGAVQIPFIIVIIFIIVNMVLTFTETTRHIRDREKGVKGVWRWGEREIIYLLLHCHHQNDFCIKTGSDESHFNEGQSHKTVSTDHNF